MQPDGGFRDGYDAMVLLLLLLLLLALMNFIVAARNFAINCLTQRVTLDI